MREILCASPGGRHSGKWNTALSFAQQWHGFKGDFTGSVPLPGGKTSRDRRMRRLNS
jgi:hypothetical protein